MQNLQELINVPSEQRDWSWKMKFYESIQNTPLSQQEEFIGPDGFPYTRVVLEDSSSAKKVFFKDLLEACLEEGRGVACYDADGNMVWVFSYGALRSLKEQGNFEVFEKDLSDNSDTVEKIPVAGMPSALERRTVEEERKVLMGSPNESFFPTYARKVVKKYLEAQGFVEPSMILLMDPTLTPPQSLLFSIFLEDFPDEEQFQTFMVRLSWFFPAPYGLSGVSKESAKEYEFVPL